MATEIDRLIVNIDANFSAMSAKLDAALAKNKKTRSDIEQAWNGAGIGTAMDKALTNLIDKMGEAAKHIPGIGAALHVLGPAGLAAAAGIGALVEAFNETKAALDFASVISKQAEALHVTTDTLQEYQQALRLAGGDQTQVASSLQEFTQFLGRAEAGMPRAIKVFQELFGQSFTKEDVQNLGGVSGAIDKITGALQNLNTEQREAILGQTGLIGMKQLFEKPKADVEDLIASTKDLGLVMDADLVQKGRELNEQLETANQKLNVDMKEAFVALGPAIVGVIKLMAELVGEAADFVDQFKKIQDRSSGSLKRDIARNTQEGTSAIWDFLPSAKIDWKTGNVMTEAQAKSADTVSAMRELINRTFYPTDQPTAPAATANLNYPTKPKKGPTDKTDQLTKTATDDELQANKALADAEKALTADVQKRAAFEEQAINDEAAVQQTKLATDLATLLKDKSIDGKTSDELQRKIEKASLEVEAARLAKLELVRRQVLVDAITKEAGLAAQAAALQQDALNAQAAHYTAQASLSDIEADRVALSKQALLAQQKAQDVANANAVGQALAATATAVVNNNPDEFAKASADYVAALQTQAEQVQKNADALALFNKQNETPFQKYQDSLKDLTTFMQDEAVSAAKDLANSLADAIVNAKNFGDAITQVFRNILQQILSEMIQKNLTAPLIGALTSGLSGLGGFKTAVPYASGTDFSAGGMALVGEHGPELVNLPTGSQVIPNAALKNLGMGKPTSNGIAINFDNRGAVIWEQAAREMMAYADRAALSAGMTAAQVARQATPNDLVSQASRRLG